VKCPYLIGDYSNVDRITVLGRGASLGHIPEIKDEIDNCFFVGNCRHALKKLRKSISGKKIVRVMNKLDTQTHKETFERFNIKDIQCNFDGWLDREIPPSRTVIYDKIKDRNPWAAVHLAPRGIRERRPLDPSGEPIGWATTGLFALDLAAFWQPKEIIVIGIDFYHSNYFAVETMMRHMESSIGQNRKQAQKMIDNFYAIVSRDKHIKFTIYTACRKIKSRENLKVVYAGKTIC
jgi:hypothetical protein